MSSRDWDATTYDRVSEPQLAWAREQLERLELSGDESVLDAGCGSGRGTAELAQRVAHGHGDAGGAGPWCAGTWSSWSSPSWLTPCSPTPPSIGSTTTPPCSRLCSGT